MKHLKKWTQADAEDILTTFKTIHKQHEINNIAVSNLTENKW